VVGLSLSLALVVGLVVWLTHQDSTYHAPLDHQPPQAGQVDTDAVAGLLARLQSAVRRHDAPAAQRLGSSATSRGLLRSVVDNARALHVTDFSLRFVDQDGAVGADGSFAADVDTTWRFAGFDHTTEHLAVRFGIADRQGRLLVDRIGGGGHRTLLWLSDPLQVRRTPTSMVLVDGSTAEASRLAGLAERAVPQVRRVLPGWTGGLVVEVPRSQHGLEIALGADRGSYDGIAAVTTTPDGSRSRRSPSHVFVNPQVFGPLRPQGAQVVITHEATHVATDAAMSTAPIWLVEGFADYVALSAQRLPVSTTAARIIALVRHSSLPRHLPDAREFAAGTPHLEARYESAWLACRLLAQAGGQDALVAFYRAVDAGGALGPELHRHVGLTVSGFVARWRALLAQVAR
jgi:hypothetical protein